MNFDSLEPFGLCVSLTIAVPTIFLGSYAYFRIWRSNDLGKSQYLRLYSFKSLNELVLYLLCIFIIRLPSQNFSHPFYQNIANSYFIWICGVIAHISNFAPYSFGVLLSINRFYAISKMKIFTKASIFDGLRSMLKSLGLIYAFPVILSIRHVIYRPHFTEFNGENGLVFFFHTPPAHIMFDILEFAFYGLTLVSEFILNVATLYSLLRNDHTKILRSRVRRQAEIGLYVTTICNFILTSLFVTQKVFIEYFPFFAIMHSISMVAHVITMDAMCIIPVYLLIAFSPTLRSQIFSAIHKKNEAIAISSIDSEDIFLIKPDAKLLVNRILIGLWSPPNFIPSPHIQGKKFLVRNVVRQIQKRRESNYTLEAEKKFLRQSKLHTARFGWTWLKMNFGAMDTISLYVSLIISVPSIFIGIYVFYRIWHSTEFGKRQYLRLYTFKSFNELVLYLLNLFLVRLPVQSFMHSFFQGIANSLLIWILGVLFSLVILAPFPFGIALSVNRFNAISREENFAKSPRSLLYSLPLIYSIPLILTIRHLIWIPHLAEHEHESETVFCFLTPSAPIIWDYLVFGFYGTSILVELLINIATLYSLIENDKSKSLNSPARRHAEINLYVTTVCNFVLTSLYVTFQLFVQLFPFSPLVVIAGKGHSIIIDTICIAPVYFLIAFSHSLRSRIFPTARSYAISNA